MQLPCSPSCATFLMPALFGLIGSACIDGPDQSSGPRPNIPSRADLDDDSDQPIRLSYVCGNKFVVVNAHTVPVTVTWRVSETSEEGEATIAAAEAHGHPSTSELMLETRTRGTVELSFEGRRIKARANGRIPCTPSTPVASFASAVSAESGEWGPVFTWPVVAIHSHLLPDGRVLAWGRTGTPQLWNPATGAFTPASSPANLFCSGHSFTGDGRLVVIGGHISNDHGIPNITLFSASGGWSTSTPMQRGRWYPTATTMSNGEVVTIAGRDQNAVVVPVPEVWSGSGVRALTGASLQLPYFPAAWLAPNGRLFYAGEQQMSRYLDISGSGSWSDVGPRRFGTRDYGAGVMYDDGKILYVGGGRTTNTAETIDLNLAAPVWEGTGPMAYPRRHLNATVLPTGEVLVTGGTGGTVFNDLTQIVRAAEIWNPATGLWTTLASSQIERSYHSTALLLPDGRVLTAGGGEADPAPIQRNGEIFSPPYLFRGARPSISSTPGSIDYGTTFEVTTPDPASITRVSLIRAGSVTHSTNMNQRFQWLSFTPEAGSLTITAPADRNRTPPGHYMLFLLNGEGVPSVAKIVMVGSVSAPPPPPPPPPSSITLTTSGRSDGTKQYMTLDWTGANGPTVDVFRNGVLITTTANDGHYTNSRTFQGTITYRYRVCATGTTTCSNEAVVQFGSAPPPPPPPTENAAPVANFTSSCSGLTCAFTDGSSDGDGTVTAWSWTFGDGTGSTARNPSRTFTGAGTYTVTLRVTDDDGATNQRSAPLTVGGATSIVLNATGRADATTQYMTLTWTGASGAMVDVYRNGVLIKTTENDGKYTNSRGFVGPATYRYRVCQAGTSTCSNEATVVFR